MIITTTPNVEGKKITAYHGIVFGEVVLGVNFVQNFSAGITNFFGGRSDEYEKVLLPAREKAIYEMTQRAYEQEANAVVGVKIDYEVLGGSLLMVAVSGTAVTVT